MLLSCFSASPTSIRYAPAKAQCRRREPIRRAGPPLAALRCYGAGHESVGLFGLEKKEGRGKGFVERLSLGRLEEDGFSYKENFIVRCYEVGINRTATVETIAMLLQQKDQASKIVKQDEEEENTQSYDNIQKHNISGVIPLIQMGVVVQLMKACQNQSTHRFKLSLRIKAQRRRTTSLEGPQLPLKGGRLDQASDTNTASSTRLSTTTIINQELRTKAAAILLPGRERSLQDPTPTPQ